MTWRGSTDVKDRIFAALPYLLPLIIVFPFGRFLLPQLPVLGLIYVPLLPLMQIYSFPFAGFIIFIVLFLAVVRNERINHFIRFNAMQAILLDILLILISLVMGIFARGGLGASLLVETLYNVVFLGTLAACGYSIVQSLLGRYAEIPAISDAAYAQVR